MFVDYYAVLGLRPSCTAREIRDAFKRLALLCHPDRADDAALLDFRGVKDAYDVLSDPARRYLYDLGYADVLRARQRQQEEDERRRAERAPPAVPLTPPPAAPPPPLPPAAVSPDAASSRSSSRTLRTPLSASQRTLPPAARSNARASPPCGSAVSAVRGARAPKVAQPVKQARGGKQSPNTTTLHWTPEGTLRQTTARRTLLGPLTTGNEHMRETIAKTWRVFFNICVPQGETRIPREHSKNTTVIH